MEGIIKWIKRQWYKQYTYQTRYDSIKNGKFKVLYTDINRESTPMCWKAASDYAEIFNGKVLDNF